ncbi:coagulation factor XIII A chain-like [Anguilla rostrata]|uniref:coagulation factor XIII A chain-like n=1 Tax=Anguilla rostrata TaxID=7938 RepID=UPI0030D571F2
MCNSPQDRNSTLGGLPLSQYKGNQQSSKIHSPPASLAKILSFLQQRLKMEGVFGQDIHFGRFSSPVDHSNLRFPPFAKSDSLGVKTVQPRIFQPPVELVAEDVDTNYTRNNLDHHTNLFEEQALIVRRGQQFEINILFNQEMSPYKHLIYVKFEIGDHASTIKGTKVILPPVMGVETDWKMEVMPFSGHKVPVSITPPSDCIVGRFRMTIGIETPFNEILWQPGTVTDVYILFNPWLKEDIVHLPSERERNEYVLEQAGCIYNGTAVNPSPVPWNFGQFQQGILTACLEILDDSNISITNRGDAVIVVRMGSALMNSQDDNGVLVGNWSGRYRGGTPPLSWIGSTEILRQYHRKKHPVRYAQCWVYAGVFNTFLRCLGIPARVITNYRSAHDNDGNLKTDIILTRTYEFDRARTRDSLWNYHCWNECYMDRNDLPNGLGGWQVVDSTPQETSDGMYRCGPSSVEAIKHGLICYPFDARFVFAEVNSDIVFHAPGPTGRLEVIFVDRTTVGWKLVTKEIGRRAPADITNQYKFREGTVESEMTVKNAEQYGCRRKGPYAPPSDVELKVEVSPALVYEGFKVTLHLTNLSSSSRTIDLYVSGNVVYYTGVHSTQFKFQNLQAALTGWETATQTLAIDSSEYEGKLVDQGMLLFFIVGNVKETNKALITTKVVNMETPKLTIMVSENPMVGDVMTIRIEFKNSSSHDLEDTYLHLEIAGVWVFAPKTYKKILSNTTVTWVESFVPRRATRALVIASLYSSPLPPVYTEEEIHIRENAVQPELYPFPGIF